MKGGRPGGWLTWAAPMVDTAGMTSRLAAVLSLCAVLCAAAAPASAGSPASRTEVRRGVPAPDYQPDAWIKLCGLSTGCTIDPLPHPWRGNDVYNSSGAKQKVRVRIDDGEGVRFFILIQNDGTQADTVTVRGCKGTPKFRINAVLMGKQKVPNWRAKNITERFKQGTQTFSLPGSATPKNVVFTLNIVTKTPGLTYSCPITVISGGPTPVKDTVVATMTTY